MLTIVLVAAAAGAIGLHAFVCWRWLVARQQRNKWKGMYRHLFARYTALDRIAWEDFVARIIAENKLTILEEKRNGLPVQQSTRLPGL